MEGYAKIASFMSSHSESAQVLRFSDISLQNILYLQAEIYGLREDLRHIEKQNQSSSSEELKNLSLDWFTLASTQNDNGQTNEQWQKFVKLRKLLKDYNEAVLQYHQLSKIPNPSTYDLEGMREWLRRPTLGSIYLTGRDREIWYQGTDLMSIGDRQRSNSLISWISETLLPIFQRLRGQHMTKNQSDNSEFGINFQEYSRKHVIKAANLFGAVLASLLPVIAIIVLYLVEGMGARLGLVALFSTFFSACLWFLNDGNMVEVFSATSAFAAVQVVFIGTNG